MEEELSYVLKKNNTLQSERDGYKNLYSNLQTTYNKKLINHKHQLEIIDSTFLKETIKFENILNEKNKKIDELIFLNNSLMDEIETLRINKVSLS